MDERDKQILRQNRTFIVNNLHDIHNISEDLYSCNILTESMRSEIMAETTPIKQSRKLLDILPKRGSQAFRSFISVLVDNGHEHLADKLSPSLAAELSSSSNSNPAIVVRQESTQQPPADKASTSPADESPSVSAAIGKDTGFQAVHGPKGVQPQDVVGQKGVCRQESSPQLLSIKDFVERLDNAPGSKDFSITPCDVSRASNLPQSQKHYPMPSRPFCGRALIISNTEFKNKLPERPHQCNSVDSSRLIQMFQDLKFRVLPNVSNLDLKQTREKLENLAKADHSKSDCFVLAILSHGKGSSIYTADGELISIQEITEIFSDTRAPSLKGKPKIFIIQAAEYNDMNRHDSASSDLIELGDRLADLSLSPPVNVNVTDTCQDVLDQPSSPDMFVVLGTAGHSLSYGSYFIQVLVNYICKLVYECHLEEIIKKVNSIDVVDTDKELCVYKSSLTKDFYFFTSV